MSAFRERTQGGWVLGCVLLSDGRRSRQLDWGDKALYDAGMTASAERSSARATRATRATKATNACNSFEYDVFMARGEYVRGT